MNRDTANFQATPTLHSQNPSQLLSSSTGRAPLSTALPHLDKALIPPVNHAANTPADILPAASQFALPGWTQLGPSAAGAEGGNGNVDSGSNENGDAEGPQTPLSPGIRRGEITELSGPRGSGKTSLAMTTAVNALKQGETVIWIDTAGPICMSRFEKMLSRDSTPLETQDRLRNLLHYQPTTLAHLLALISHPIADFPPPNTGLIVVDSISCLFGSEFRSKLPAKLSKAKDLHGTGSRASKEAQESKLWWKLIGSLSSNLNALASRFDCAVIVVNEMVTRFRSGQKPMLHVAISGYTWDTSVATRVILYWHWLDGGVREKFGMARIRIAEVFRAGKKAVLPRAVERIVPFLVEDEGLVEFMRLPISLGGTRGTVTPVSAKRKLDGDELLGAQLPRRPKIELDSEGEDEEDESVEEEKKLEEKPARTSLPTEIMDSQDEEEDEEWLEAVDLQSSTEPNTQQEEDDTEQLLRSMVEGDV
ncbi:DNA repair protein [Trichophyton mentagrophytes]|nr:DNA repair protein [Trichophyton mentagrophytes]